MDPQNPEYQVTGLLNLARNRSSMTREALLAIGQDLFGGRENVLTQSDRILMHNLVRSLIDRVEGTVRSELINYLGSLPTGPRAILAHLAGVKQSIAYPILMDSGVLMDTELVEALYYKALQHQVATARRQSAGPNVDELIAAAASHQTNAERQAAPYSSQAPEPLGAPEPPVIEPGDLTHGLVRRLSLWCSVALRQHLLEQHRTDEIVLDDALEYAVDQAARSLGGRAPSEEPARKIPSAATPASLISLLEAGQLSEFEAAFARMSELRPNLARRMIYEQGGEGLATICVATDVPRRTFAAIYLLTRDPDAAGVQQVAGALAFFDRLNPVAARRVVARWRRDADYLNAIRELSGTAS